MNGMERSMVRNYSPSFSKPHIMSVLRSRGIKYIDHGREILIQCPFHLERLGKSDNTPSLHLKSNGTKANCFPCGWHGSWKGIAKRINGSAGEAVHDTSELVYEIESIKKAEKRITLPRSVKPWEGCWRKLPNSFLDPLAYLWYDSDWQLDRILFPDRQTDQLVWVAGVIHEKDRSIPSKWRNADGMASAKCFFGESHIGSRKKVALVEGPYDMLRLTYHGIPTLSVLGTSNWNKFKAERLANLGIGEVLVLTDEDKPGIKCRKKIKRDCYRLFEVRSIRLPSGSDPGNIPLSLIRKIKKKTIDWGW